MRSELALLTLWVLGMILRMDTMRVECRHAWIRKMRNLLNTPHLETFIMASASFVLQRLRVIENAIVSQEKAAAPKKPKPVRGGGACRAFLSEYMVGKTWDTST